MVHSPPSAGRARRFSVRESDEEEVGKKRCGAAGVYEAALVEEVFESDFAADFFESDLPADGLGDLLSDFASDVEVDVDVSDLESDDPPESLEVEADFERDRESFL